MSLINDALKQAKQAQQEAAPPVLTDLQLRPIEPAQYTRQSIGLIIPAVFVVVALLVLLPLWIQAHRTVPAQPMEVQARTAMPAGRTAMPHLAPAAAAPVPAEQSIPQATSAPSSAPNPGPADVVETAAVPLPADAPAVAAPDNRMTQPPAAVEAPPPKLALPKLQAIVFSPTRASVMIGGRTLFVGDKLDGLRVTAIGRESVTLAGEGQTNVLTLSE